MNITEASETIEESPSVVADATSINETVLIVTLCLLAFVLAPLTVAFNLLVIVPFCRFSRVRTASNQILLALAITDLLLGMVLCMASITALTNIATLDKPHPHISYAIVMAFATLQVQSSIFFNGLSKYFTQVLLPQATSLMLMMATSGDKALSLVRPLDYNEIVTFTSVNAYISFSILLGIILGVVIPLTTSKISHSDLFILLPLGLCRQNEMHMAILVFFTVPCGLFVTLCHIYVYMVANRHANAIKRDSYVRERMMTSASYKMTTTSIEHPTAAASTAPNVLIGMEPIVNKNSNYLTIPINNSCSALNHQSTSFNASKAIEKGFSIRRQDSNEDSSYAKTRPNRYGASLLLVVLVVFASRMPSELWPFLRHDHDLSFHQFFYVLANIPLFLCSAANPWIYAYHNLDLKPAMQKLLKRACRGIIRPSQRHRRSKSNQTSLGHRSYLANWQISVFATYSHGIHHSTRQRRSSWHQEAVSLNQQQQPSQPSPTGHFRSNSHCHRYHRRKSFGAIAAAVRKTRRSKSCTNRAIPTVTVWDGDSVRLTRPEDML